MGRNNVLAFSVALALTGSLSACGGGGGNGNVKPSTATPTTTSVTSTPTTTTNSPTPAPTLTPGLAPTPAPAPSSTITSAQVAAELRLQLDPENVPTAWNSGGSSSSVQGQGVKVGILDTGVQAGNPALSGRISWFRDYVDPSNSTPTDPLGHGSVVAQILGGTANADGPIGDPFYGGVAPQSSLYVARVGDASGSFAMNLLPQAYSDLLNQGVRLFNNSYSIEQTITSQSTGAGSLVAQEQAYFQPAVNAGSLLIWAAGNSGHGQPNVEPGLPYLEPSLQKGWLAVVNVIINASGQVVGLDNGAEPSNGCGVAAAWCLAAPGNLTFSPVTGTSFSTGAGEGTSFSAPIVTGVAALVWQRFPYFTGNNVQETLLGTATSLGDPALYGYGLVNAAAAVNGPGALDWGVFDVNIPSGASGVFSNNMSGSGTLQLDGAGSLALTGNDSFGGINVNGGTLTATGTDSFSGNVAINGGSFVSGNSLSAANITIAQGASLFASGVLAGAISNSGTLNGVPQASSSALQIHGSYSASSSANTVVALGSPITISNQATLNSSTLTVISNSASNTAGMVLQAMGGVTGRFGTLVVQGSVFGSGSLSYTPTEVDVLLYGPQVAGVAASSMPNVATTQQTAQHIQTALNQTYTPAAGASGNSAFLSAEGEFLRVSSLEQAQASINSLSGQMLVSSQALTFAQGGIINRSVADRLASIDDAPDRQGAWLQATGASGDIGQSGYATGSYSGGGSVAGYDMAIGDSATVGVGADWNRLDANYDLQAGSGSSRAFGAMLYGRYDIGAAYVSGRAGEDWIHSSTSRWAMLGGNSAAIASVRKDRLTTLYGETGYVLHAADWTLTPFVAASFEKLARGQIDESGAGGFGIAAAAASFEQSSGQLGARLAHQWRWQGGETTLQAYALYQRLASGSNLAFTAAYAGAPAATFQLQGVNSPRGSGWAGVEVSTQLASRWSWFVDLSGEFTGGRTDAGMISAGARFRF
ncbi:S8 family serine peptidase [Dyella acidiphila]|uniref:Autotransporter domain-containing protein n=1 Tax=Dyella acidiphila TaxID=2775866 RepID=A0ABR9G7Y7_9GAMM|nr:S8 family serine peptidase [Dyella acidiphila]MBE1160173.1 autotransporter domain-containing protein [Dyella acidiphila]